MSKDNSKGDLPAVVKTGVELQVATTNVTAKAITKLKKEAKDLPTESNDENVAIWRDHRKSMKDMRGSAKDYVIALKKKVKALGQKVEDDWEILEQELKDIENSSDVLIKKYEKEIKEKREAKKKEKLEKAALSKKIDDEIQALGNIPVKFIKSSSKDISAEIESLESIEFSDNYGDRVGEAEMKVELSLENLRELLDAAVEKEKAAIELKETQDKLAEQKKKDDAKAIEDAKKEKAVEVEKKRVEDIKEKIASFEKHIVKAVMAKNLGVLEVVCYEFFQIKIGKGIYKEFTIEAQTKHAEVVEKLNELLNAKKAEETKVKDAKAAQDKLDQDQKDLDAREAKLKAQEDAIKNPPEPIEEDEVSEPVDLNDEDEAVEVPVIGASNRVVNDKGDSNDQGEVVEPKPYPYSDNTDEEKIEALKEWIFNSPEMFPEDSYHLINDVITIAENNAKN